MADSEYTIDVQAKSIGAGATAAQVNSLADSLDAAGKVATQFDGALEAAGAQLADAASLAESTSAALADAEGSYSRLERAATAAAKRVEKAAAAGKDTSQLQAAADAAAAAVRQQADAVDEARRAASKAAGAHEKLADSYRTIERAAERAAEETRGADRSFGDLFGAAGALGGPLGGLAGQISGIGDGLRAGGLKGGLILGAFAAGNAFIMWAKAAIGLTLALGGVVAGLLAYAVAADKATSKKLESAWERAGKRAKKLFEGVKTEKLVRPVESLLKLLDKSTSAGKGLAKIFETLLNPVIEGFDKGEPLIKDFFKGIIIGALKAIVFVLKLRNAILRAVPKETREKIDKFINDLLSLQNVAKSGETAFKAFGLVLLGLTIPLALLGVFFAMVGLVLVNMVTTAESAIVIVTKLAEALEEATDPAAVERNVAKIEAKLRGLGKIGGKTGQDLVNGLINGIKAGESPVSAVARGLVLAALKAMKGASESASPSKVLIRHGRDDLAGGMAIGLKRGEPEVERAGQGVGEAGVRGVTSPGRRTAPAGSTSSRTINIAPGAVQINNYGGGEDLKQAAREAAQELLEMVAIQLGGEAVSGAA